MSCKAQEEKVVQNLECIDKPLLHDSMALVQKDRFTRKPEFIGGNHSYNKFIETYYMNDTTFSLQQYTDRLMYVKIHIDSQGNVQFKSIVKGINGCIDCDLVVRKIISKMPIWKPAYELSEKKDTINVDSEIIIQIPIR